ncbi:LCP family protein required for cell wall assembly [Kibdelosporangium banguiense]|uniref:LCP family protein required for cell wall assembly n=1 Tax=Kibdelosporangium banguiense TaxID=1365924 RepID=A0ABS4TAY9_9PSEU|nr:LCP family protein [Kibdelosporangium banguiense]MBP2321585.1 LCP family protein required for cell wall assembly [Kibdelosporangium banguiense]
MDALGGARRRWRRSVLVVVRTMWILVSIVMMVAAGVAWATYQDLDTGVRRSKAIPPDAARSVGAMNLLVMGLTTRLDLNGDPLPDDILAQLQAGESDRGGYNANTLMLLHIPNDGSQATALSVPRDNFVDLHGVPGAPVKGKIKEAYGRAKIAEETRLRAAGLQDLHELEYRGREAGRRAQIETVSTFLDVPIDHMAEVSLAGFYYLARALGGIEVCVNNATRDPMSGSDLVAGRQTLNASQALAFVRQRHGLKNGDLDRTRRQQAFIAAVTYKLRGQGAATDPKILSGLMDVAKQNVVLDEGMDLFDFALRASSLTGGRMTYLTLPIEDTQTVDGESINIVDVTKVRKQVGAMIGPNLAKPSSPPPTTATTTAPTTTSAPPPPAAIPCVD